MKLNNHTSSRSKKKKYGYRQIFESPFFKAHDPSIPSNKKKQKNQFDA